MKGDEMDDRDLKAISEPFEQWIERLKKVAAEQYGFTDNGIVYSDWSAFRGYYDDGYTPEQALAEDASYA